MGLFHTPKCQLLSMLCLTFFFFLVEIVVGYFTNSTALIADSFHMLSDVVALVIAYVSVRMSPKKWSKNTFGWARAEVLGALINAVFLLALCFSILIESFKRFVDPEKLHNPLLVLVVGIIGLIVNLIGLALFHEHGHSHGGHTHVPQQEDLAPVISTAEKNDEKLANGSSISADKKIKKKSNSEQSKRSSSNMNMHGVFLHVLADALGSIIVIISALIIHFTTWDYNIYVDPALSIIMVIIISYSTLPLLIDSALILLQTVPTHIQIDSLQKKLLDEIDGVLAVHEFHVWQLAGDRIIASAHIRCRNLRDYMQIAEKVKEFFHNEGIHSTTIQPEFIEFDQVLNGGNENKAYNNGQSDGKKGTNQSRNSDTELKNRWSNDVNCQLDCPPGQMGQQNCLQNTCCGPQQKRSPTLSENTELDEVGILGGQLELSKINRNENRSQKKSLSQQQPNLSTQSQKLDNKHQSDLNWVVVSSDQPVSAKKPIQTDNSNGYSDSNSSSSTSNSVTGSNEKLNPDNNRVNKII